MRLVEQRPNQAMQHSAQSVLPRGHSWRLYFLLVGGFSAIAIALICFHPILEPWLTPPAVNNKILMLSAGLTGISCCLLTKICPVSHVWSRRFIAGLLILLLSRYMLWRCVSTLNTSSVWASAISFGLLALEILMAVGSFIQLGMLFNWKNRSSEADAMAHLADCTGFAPSVDIFIPTYNEAEFIVRRTIIGCQNIEYGNKEVYLLDDTARPEMQRLAEALGCHYISRSGNNHAKAGNLNNALKQTSGDLIVVFDADFIPTQNFLERTVGFFQNQAVGIVQTPQSFYNPDPIARNLGMEDVLTPDEEVFYRQIQPIKDAAGSVICAGTSFVVRRSALASVGGFTVESNCEDYFTGIQLNAVGYKTLYLNEKLSAGLAAETITAYATQRLRWSQGTLQAFFISSNPLTIKGLTLRQRLAHLEGLLHWFSSWSRAGFLLVPLIYLFGGISPISASTTEVLYFFIPYYLVQLAVFSWLNGRSRSALLADLYSLILVFPLAVNVIKTLKDPFGKGFTVTPKGLSSNQYQFNFNLALPLLLVLVITIAGLVHQAMTLKSGGWENIGLGWFWGGYNILMLSASLLVLVDAPKPTPIDWYGKTFETDIKIEGNLYRTTSRAVSEQGIQVNLPALVKIIEKTPVTVKIPCHDFQTEGWIESQEPETGSQIITIKFKAMTLENERRLIALIYCQPWQWRRIETPHELRSLLLILRSLLAPRFLTDKNNRIKALPINQ